MHPAGQQTGGAGATHPAGESVAVRDFTFPLIGGGMAVLRAPLPMSDENYTLIKTMLETMKKAIVTPTGDQKKKN